MAAARKKAKPDLAEVMEHIDEAAGLLKALASDQRLLVMCCLLEGPLSVGEINTRVPLSQSALSQHLGILREAGVVTTRRESQTIYYALADGPATEIMTTLHASFCAPARKRHPIRTVAIPRRS